MRSRNSRSRSRSRSPPSRRDKKSEKDSRRSENRDVSPMDKDGDSNGQTRLHPVMSAPSLLNTLDLKDDEKPSTPTDDQSSGKDDRPTFCSIVFFFVRLGNATTRKRKRRFGDESERVFLPHMPTNISATNMSDQEQKVYIRKFFTPSARRETSPPCS